MSALQKTVLINGDLVGGENDLYGRGNETHSERAGLRFVRARKNEKDRKQI